MAIAEHINGSALTAVVDHEKTLLADLDAARDEARRIIESARSEAAGHEAAEQSRLNADVAEMRAKAERERTEAFNAAIQKANDSLDGVRKEVHARVPEVAEQVMALFTPQVGKKGGSA